MRTLSAAFWLGLKEIASLLRDPVLLFLIVYSFSIAVVSVARGARMEVNNAAVGIVDEDGSSLSRAIAAALLEPRFQPPIPLQLDEVDEAFTLARSTFVLDVPPDFERDILAGHTPDLGLAVDATAIAQAGSGAGYISQIVQQEVATFLSLAPDTTPPAFTLAVRTAFNPNLDSQSFNAVMQMVNSVSILSIILTGAAVIREREHGTLEHLLVMPLRPLEVMLAKIWANGLIVLAAATFCLTMVIRWFMAVPIAGSTGLFVAGTALYLLAVTSLGIMLATIARTMPQFGLLAIPVFVVMNLLSGSSTPLDAMPPILQWLMQASPSTHFVSFAQGVLYRGAGFEIVWPQMLAILALGGVFFAIALRRFRTALFA
ncbi:MAG TPA: ABC transporter permease [Geminicoccus sp.]|jgi:ABC-2 type transport system permease protein|uniref:ABC transporter permease n=1 Tax=Geminicoccus sp. TaxID=2024832 RepID=UPI002E3479E1|nr:ABC transporter permease [Geminicoccus sp.]HEX2526713.1 ABC transporter permease [Geminicoccus sp.]